MTFIFLFGVYFLYFYFTLNYILKLKKLKIYNNNI